MVFRKGHKRISKDREMDRTEFNGHTLVLLEDRTMLRPYKTSRQYIIAILGKKGNLDHKRYITDLAVSSAKYFAQSIFVNPDKYKHILGLNWMGYELD